jgi:phosphoribosylformylglycinamidine cyclo-ligase
MGITYRDSGVDIEKGDRFVDLIKKKLRSDERQNIGGFGGMFDLGPFDVRHPVLVASTDGVGTKLVVAKQAGDYSTIGIDLVAMCVNDLVCTGARPLFFLDYLATSNLDLEEAGQVMDGILEGCRRAGCSLLGGETAEMPSVYKRGDYELAGFSCGIVEKERIIDPGRIEEGNLLIGIRSSGIHSNGFSLARKALFEKGGFDMHYDHPALGRSIAQELLMPTRIYVKTVLEMLSRVNIRGIAHITGGGLEGNVQRLLPEGLGLEILWDSLAPHPMFMIIKEAGGIEEEEMRRTFNLGVGLVFVVDNKVRSEIVEILKSLGEEPVFLGTVVKASGHG